MNELFSLFISFLNCIQIKIMSIKSSTGATHSTVEWAPQDTQPLAVTPRDNIVAMVATMNRKF